MRITEKMIFEQASSDITGLRSRLFERQHQATTGQRFHSLEEDPLAAERIRLVEAARQASIQYDDNIQSSQTELQAVEGVLEEATNLAIRAKEIAMMTGSDIVAADERAIAADEVQSLFDAMVAVANTKANESYVFGGFQTDTIAFQDDGTFVGDTGVKNIEVGPDSQLTVNVSGADTFTASGGIDVFAEMETFRQALIANDVPAIQNAIVTMQEIAEQLTQSRTDAGMKMNRLDMASELNSRMQDNYLAQKSSLIDADSVEVLLDLNATTTALENAIGVARRVTSTSLLGV